MLTCGRALLAPRRRLRKAGVAPAYKQRRHNSRPAPPAPLRPWARARLLPPRCPAAGSRPGVGEAAVADGPIGAYCVGPGGGP